MGDARRVVRVFAPAKINLALHVTGRREDGYHLLDSLVVFADVGDTLAVASPGGGAFTFGGTFGSLLSADAQDNLVARLARRFRPCDAFDFHLDKELPVSSGIGGGSADAAACYRALSFLSDTGSAHPDGDVLEALLEIGADVPVCVQSRPAFLRGIGERVDLLPACPTLWSVLVNPREALSTPRVFKALTRRDNPGLAPLPEPLTAATLTAWLGEQRNDLEAAAIGENPRVAQVLAALEATAGCALARMSGSGATCFGLYSDEDTAGHAARMLAGANPGWWVRATVLGGEPDVAPQLMRSTT